MFTLAATKLNIPINRYLRIVAGLGIAGLSVYLAVRDVSLGQVTSAFARANWGLVGLALLSVVANTFSKVMRWQSLLTGHGRKVGLFRLIMALLAGQTLNVLYPARVGDLVRAYAVGDTAEQKAFSLGTVALEKAADVVSYALLLLLLIGLMPLPVWISRSAYGLAGGALLMLFAIMGLLRYRQQAPKWLSGWKLWQAKWMPKSAAGWLSRLLPAGFSSLDVLKNGRSLLSISGWSLLVWGTATLTNMLVILALRISLKGVQEVFLAALLVLMGLMLGISIPSVPGRVGIFEYVCVLSLAVFGIPQAAALTYGILLHAVVLLPSTLAGLIAISVLGLANPARRQLVTFDDTLNNS